MTQRAASFKVEQTGAIVKVTFSRPERLNALTFQVYEELTGWFERIRQNSSVRAIVLAGEGDSFCSGGDVKDIIGPLLKRDMQGTLEFTRLTGRLITNIIRCTKPVVAELKGVIAGAGAVIALAADLRIATPECRFAFLFTRVGLAGCDMGAAYLLPRVVGLGRALEALYLGDFIDAAEAHRIGLVNRIVRKEQIEESSAKLAAQLCELPAFGLSMTKEMVFKELAMDFEAAIEGEAQA